MRYPSVSPIWSPTPLLVTVFLTLVQPYGTSLTLLSVLLGTLCDLVAIPPTPSTSDERQMRKPNQVLNSCADHAPQPPAPSSHTRTRTPHLSSWDWNRDLLYKRHHYSIVQSPTPAAPNCTFNRNVLTHHTAPIHSQIAFINYKRSYASLRATSNL